MKFKIYDKKSKAAVLAYVEKLNPEKRYEVSVSLRREIRTLSQNRLYWLYLACLEQETGNEKEALHDFFKRKWLRKNTTKLQNEQIISVYSTAELNTVQFNQYIEKIVLFAAEEGIILPDPNDLSWSQFYDTYKDFI